MATGSEGKYFGHSGHVGPNDPDVPMTPDAKAFQLLQLAKANSRIEVDMIPQEAVHILAACVNGDSMTALKVAGETYEKYEGEVGIFGLFMAVAADYGEEKTRKELQKVLSFWEKQEILPFEKGVLY